MTGSDIDRTDAEAHEMIEGEGDAELQQQLQELKERLEECEDRADSSFERLQRLQAEFENYKKRIAKETMETIEYANEEIILSLLEVLDNFERAIDSIQQENDVDAVKKGIEMIFQQLCNLLEREDVIPIEAVGKIFDPYLHETIAKVKSDVDSNTVVEELQRGYKYKSKVIRPCMVRVAE
ncbi:MAG TPA: nucleotide exchange factor GrpE [Methanosarcinales archaeon]|nr:nucleotide exchange factor GrpE [Methanosarcinales archaeon]